MRHRRASRTVHVRCALVDGSAGTRQRYVEDCQICCKPNVLDVHWSPSDQAFLIHAELES